MFTPYLSLLFIAQYPGEYFNRVHLLCKIENKGNELKERKTIKIKTRSSWLNCAARDDEAVYWVSVGHYEAEAVGN